MRAFILLLPLTFITSSVSAQPLAVTNTFSNTTVADADQVNQNFADIEVWINAYLIIEGTNTALGREALINTTGINNTAIGAYALLRNTTGYENTASGVAALYFNEDGNYNTAIGAYALYSNTTGSGNTASGRVALVSNTTGVENTAIGANALSQNVGGQENTALGYLALNLNSSGNLNTAGGHESMKDNRTGNRNTAWGVKALYLNTAGNKNTAIGWQALGNSQGDSNTALGDQADVSVGAEDVTNATAIGSQAKVDQSNKIQLGNPAVLSVATAGKLTTGSVTYPNTHGTAGYVLTTNGSGELVWAAPPTASNQAVEELEEQVASLQQQLQNQKKELLAVVQSQQGQIAQLQRMVEHQFAAR